MAQTNLLLKVLFCLRVPAYQALQQSGSTSSSSLSLLRYWLVLSLIFLTELFLDQVSLSLSPSCSVLKLFFLAWCVLPVDNNGTLLIWENVRFYFSV